MEIPDRLILFDGVCNLCSSSVKFILKYDKKKVFRYAPLQWAVSAKILKSYKHIIPFDTLIFIDKGTLYHQSTAALKIVKHLRFFWVLYYLTYIPKWIRDPVYRLIARNRYRIFGNKKHCYIPTEKEKELFVSIFD
ncbi:MAG: DUF393 domain-containing protein [Prolixibacteraceae bacterium]|nr:DUF393 domain-containing protein [Prolixibacteraceae bacterium]